jgi:serine/threonine-protein kinase
LLTDFGFARLMGDSSVSLSLSGGILGTPAYIAPEVWELDAAEPPADIYALGCILYEMLTGEVLFAGKTPMQSMRAHDHGPQYPEAWPEDVPTGIELVLNRALAREPAARYPSGNAFWHALHDLDVQAQAAQDAAEQAAVAAQWREETETAMAEGEWSAAKMAVARWLAVMPDDAEAKAALTEIEKQLGKLTRKESPSVSIPSEGVRSKSPAPETKSERKTRSRAIPNWLWIGGGVIGILGIGFLLIMLSSGTFMAKGLSGDVTDTPRPSNTPQLVKTSTSMPTRTSTPTLRPTLTPTLHPTPRPTKTPTATSTRTAQPTATSTDVPIPMQSQTHTPIPTSPSDQSSESCALNPIVVDVYAAGPSGEKSVRISWPEVPRATIYFPVIKGEVDGECCYPFINTGIDTSELIINWWTFDKHANYDYSGRFLGTIRAGTRNGETICTATFEFYR